VLLACLLPGSCATVEKPEVQATLAKDRTEARPTLEEIVDDTFDSMFSLMAPLYLFYAQHDRWPDSGRELQATSRKFDLNFDLANYARLDLLELHDGSLLVQFQLAPPQEGGGEFILARPEFDPPPTPDPGQERVA
jgi:hypothetical protein